MASACQRGPLKIWRNFAYASFAFATAAYLSVSLAITGLASWYHHRFPVRAA